MSEVEKEHEVLERVWQPKRMLEAWRQVKRNAGAAGIDQMSVEEFAERKTELLRGAIVKLRDGTYRFKPARRVLIPKPGKPGKFRKLGIPVVLDRVVAQSVHTVLEELYDPQFSQSNFGFRRGKSQHQAIGYVRDLVAEGYSWCVSIDLASFFDEIPHDLILKLIRRKIADERLVTLIARAVKAGVVVEGKFEKSTKGVPQGSPLSPILSNIVLNELDQELDHRGLKYARWADDFVVLVRSRRAAERAMGNICAYLDRLGLTINRQKSGVSKMAEVTFLGFRIYRHKIRISPESITKFKGQVRELTHRNNPLSMHAAIQRLNLYLRGWVAYFGVQEFRELFGRIDPWIRNRLRSMQLAKWKKPRKFQRVMIAAGYPARRARRIWVAMRAWRSVRREEVRTVLGLDWFRKLGLVFLNDHTMAPTE